MGDASFRINRGVLLNPQSAAPTSPAAGNIYYDSVKKTFCYYNESVWINLASKADVASATDLTSATLTATIVANSLIRITGSAASNLHGLTASVDSKYVVIYNSSTQSMVIKHQSSTEGTAANRIITPTAADITMTAGQAVQFTYDAGQSRWIALIAPSTSAGTSAVIKAFICEPAIGTLGGTAFTCSYAPATSVMVVINGLFKVITDDFTVSGQNINFTSAPATRPYLIYGTSSKFVQSAGASGDGSAVAFRLIQGIDTLVFLDGVLNITGSENRLTSNYVEFLSAPGSGQELYFVGVGLSLFAQEKLSGTIDGVNTTFTFTTAPTNTNACIICVDGIVMQQGSGAGKYTISGNTITFGTAPVVGQVPYGFRFNE